MWRRTPPHVRPAMPRRLSPGAARPTGRGHRHRRTVTMTTVDRRPMLLLLLLLLGEAASDALPCPPAGALDERLPLLGVLCAFEHAHDGRGLETLVEVRQLLLAELVRLLRQPPENVPPHALSLGVHQRQTPHKGRHAHQRHPGHLDIQLVRLEQLVRPVPHHSHRHNHLGEGPWRQSAFPGRRHSCLPHRTVGLLLTSNRHERQGESRQQVGMVGEGADQHAVCDRLLQ
mmetsp:Transcript_6110/g.14681  ORF Transcript_6110/g.14681 Transcript_6110/m.14681 type:complete len:230 (-) Transcript_6110:115-804(-)